MRKIFLSGTFLLLSCFSHGQYFTATMLEDSVKYGPPDPAFQITIDVLVTNITSAPITLNCQRMYNNLAPDWQSAFSFVNSNPPFQDNSIVTLPAGQPTPFTFYFFVSSTPDTSDARMQISATGTNGTQNWYKIFTGITDQSLTSGAVLANTIPEVKAFPIPAHSGQPVSFMLKNFTGPAQLTVTSVNGKVLGTHEVSNGNFEFSTSGMAAGLYLWTITGQGMNPASGKFPVIE